MGGVLPASLAGLTLMACSAADVSAPAAQHGGFSVNPETCRARHPAGVILELSDARDEIITVAIQTEHPEPLRLLVQNRPVLTESIAPLHGWAFASIPADTFWPAFGQADRLEGGDIAFPVADQAGLRAALTACHEARP